MTTTKDKSWKAFFTAYAEAGNNPDVEVIAGFYAKDFIIASPKGSGSYKNDAQFREWLKQVQAFNKEAGMESMKVKAAKEIAICEEYTMVKVTWSATFRKMPDEPAVFDISYIVQTGDCPKILMYISHEDQEAVMQEKGLMPAGEQK